MYSYPQRVCTSLAAACSACVVANRRSLISLASACLCVAISQAEITALRSELQVLAKRQKEMERRVAAAAAAAGKQGATPAAVKKVRHACSGPATLICPAWLSAYQVSSDRNSHPFCFAYGREVTWALRVEDGTGRCHSARTCALYAHLVA